MNMVIDTNVLSMAEFAKDTREHTARLKTNRKPTMLTQDGEPAAVVLSVDAYEKMAWEAYEHQMDARLRVAVEAYAKGERGTPAREFFDELDREDDAESPKP